MIELPARKELSPGYYGSGLLGLKSTMFGRLYCNWLKHIPWIRNSLLFALKHIVPRVLSRKAALLCEANRRLRPIVKMCQFDAKESVVLQEETYVATASPEVLPASDQGYLRYSVAGYTFPPLCVTVLGKARVNGGTNLVITQDAVVYHDLYDFERDYTSEELHLRHLIDVQKKQIRIMTYDDDPHQLDKASSFVDACALNYAHWMTEVLPRVALFCSAQQYKDVPIIINAGLHQNILESIQYVVDEARDVYLLPIGRSIRVNKFYHVSACGYVPFDFRNKVEAPPHQGVFSPHAMRLMVDMLRAKIRERSDLPEKIYIRRNSVGKIATNLAEVEQLLLAQGFTFVAPECLNFQEQMEIFAHAKVVVGSSGAAMANIIFCSPSAKVIILIGKSKRVSHFYWPNIAASCNVRVTYVLGEVPLTEKDNNQPNFTVPLAELATAIAPQQ